MHSLEFLYNFFNLYAIDIEFMCAMQYIDINQNHLKGKNN